MCIIKKEVKSLRRNFFGRIENEKKIKKNEKKNFFYFFLNLNNMYIL